MVVLLLMSDIVLSSCILKVGYILYITMYLSFDVLAIRGGGSSLEEIEEKPRAQIEKPLG